MSVETDELTKELSKAIKGVAFLAEATFYIALVISTAYAVYFAYGWVITHPERVLLIVGCCAFWIITNWRKP